MSDTFTLELYDAITDAIDPYVNALSIDQLDECLFYDSIFDHVESLSDLDVRFIYRALSRATDRTHELYDDMSDAIDRFVSDSDILLLNDTTANAQQYASEQCAIALAHIDAIVSLIEQQKGK